MKDELPSDELIAAERPAFEVWCKSEGIDAALWIKDQPQCGYTNARTTDYWTGWIARALLAEQARTEPTGGFARLAPNALPVGTLYPAIYPAKAATQPLKAEQAKDAAEDAEILAAVHRELDDGDRTGNAPGHDHKLPGIWDDDNGAKSGKPCAWCLTWVKFTALIDRAARAAERKA